MPFKVLAHSDATGAFRGGPSWVTANATSSGIAILDKTITFTMRRNGNATPIRMQNQCGGTPGFHHLVDPDLPPVNLVLVFEDMVQGIIAAETCEVVHGFCQHLTVTTINTLVGVGFRAGTDTSNEWHCFVNDCPTGVAPVTVVYDFDTGISMNDLHRLAIVFNGLTKTIEWYIDRVLVASYTPVVPLDRMGTAADTAGPLVMTCAVVPANGDCTVRCRGGAFPQLRVAPYPVGGDPIPPTPTPQVVGQLWPRGNMIGGI